MWNLGHGDERNSALNASAVICVNIKTRALLAKNDAVWSGCIKRIKNKIKFYVLKHIFL